MDDNLINFSHRNKSYFNVSSGIIPGWKTLTRIMPSVFSVPADYRMGTVLYSKIRPIGCCWIGYAAGKDCQEYSAIGCSTKNKLGDYL